MRRIAFLSILSLAIIVAAGAAEAATGSPWSFSAGAGYNRLMDDSWNSVGGKLTGGYRFSDALSADLGAALWFYKVKDSSLNQEPNVMAVQVLPALKYAFTPALYAAVGPGLEFTRFSNFYGSSTSESRVVGHLSGGYVFEKLLSGLDLFVEAQFVSDFSVNGKNLGGLVGLRF